MAKKFTEEEYRKAAIVWRKNNPKKKKISIDTVIFLEDNKKIQLGKYFKNLKNNYENLQEEQKEFWKDFGLELGIVNYKEEEYQKAAIIWRKKYPNKQIIHKNAIVKIENGKEIPLGEKLRTMRENLESLTEEEKEFWIPYGLYFKKKQSVKIFKEEEFKEAATLWKKENPDSKMISIDTIITIGNGKKIPLGRKFASLRANPTTLKDDEKEFWSHFGLYSESIFHTEEEYREAAKIWEKENPTKKYILIKTKVIISSGKEIPLGRRTSTLRQVYNAMQKGERYLNCAPLTEEQIEFWSKYHIFEKKAKEEHKSKIMEKEKIYRMAAVLYLEKHQGIEEIPAKTDLVVELEGYGVIKLGQRVRQMRAVYRAMQRNEHFGTLKDLTDEQVAWWREHGIPFEKLKVYDKRNTEEVYRMAALKYLEEHPEKEYISSYAKVELEEYGTIHLGTRIGAMRQIYKAMQEGKHYLTLKDLTEEQIAWWSQHKMKWDVSKTTPNVLPFSIEKILGILDELESDKKTDEIMLMYDLIIHDNNLKEEEQEKLKTVFEKYIEKLNKNSSDKTNTYQYKK